MSNCVFPGEGRGVHEESTHHAKHKFGLHFSLINHSILQEEGAGRKSTFDHNGGGGSGFWQTINLDHGIYEQMHTLTFFYNEMKWDTSSFSNLAFFTKLGSGGGGVFFDPLMTNRVQRFP